MSVMCSPESPRRVRGVVLIEVMVGITLGLLVLAAALGASALTFSAAAAGSDAAELQQRADLALALIGRQARQAGAVQLDPAGSSVVFRTTFKGWNDKGQPVSGLEGSNGKPDTLRLSRAFVDGDVDCLGNMPAAPAPTISAASVDNEYLISPEPVNDNRPALYCQGNQTNHKQALVSGVDDLQLLYGIAGAAGTVRYVKADALTADTPVLMISVCLQLSGAGSSAAGTTADCNGKPLPAATTANRMVRLARAIFMVRNALPA